MDKPNLVPPTPSRTLRISASEYDANKYEYMHTLNGDVYFLTFDTIEEATEAYKTLKEEKLHVRYHIYSLFTKFDEVLNKEILENKVKKILEHTNYNITYMRIDVVNKNNNTNESHTGKVVVDRIEDCKALLSFKDETPTRLRFYRFDPKKAIKKSSFVTKQKLADDFKLAQNSKPKKVRTYKSTVSNVNKASLKK